MTIFRATVVPIRLPPTDLLGRGFPMYQSLLTRYPAERMFLFESLGGSSVDTRSTLIGLNPVLSLVVRGCTVRIQGHQALIDSAAIALQEYVSERSSADRLEFVLSSRKCIWDFLRRLESAFVVEKVNGAANLSLFGYLGYETIRYIEVVPQHQEPLSETPEIALTLYRSLVTLGSHSASLTDYQFSGDDEVDVGELVHLCEGVNDAPAVEGGLDEQPYVLHFETAKQDYLQKCELALEHIRLGDVYQIQIGQKLRVQSPLSPLALYARLRELNPSPYMYLFAAADRTIVGASPELFIRIDDKKVVMRPIAGTVGKSGGRSRDEARSALHGNEKEVAEHLMLVDLCRNDLCRVCEPESLLVEDLMEIEEYSHVFHMVSNTSGRLRPDCDKYDAICASFPAGTMTGTPKVRAVELIEEIEDSARGLYAGIVGLIGIGSQYINSSLFIRSAVHENGAYTLRASAGIVADSVAESEYRETLQKLGSMFKALTGKELTCAAV